MHTRVYRHENRLTDEQALHYNTPPLPLKLVCANLLDPSCCLMASSFLCFIRSWAFLISSSMAPISSCVCCRRSWKYMLHYISSFLEIHVSFILPLLEIHVSFILPLLEIHVSLYNILPLLVIHVPFHIAPLLEIHVSL